MNDCCVPEIRRCGVQLPRVACVRPRAPLSTDHHAAFMDLHDSDQQALQQEIADLERRLKHAKSQLQPPPSPSDSVSTASRALTPPPPTLHTLLLLADSALPLGSFAFSSGLESYLAHHRPPSASASQVPAFHHFLRLSLHTLASTALPYVLAGYRTPHLIETLDNDLDASTPCTVARRASIAQGRALLAVWDRSFKKAYQQAPTLTSIDDNGGDVSDAVAALTRFQTALRAATSATPLPPNAHLAPLWGLLTRVLGVDLHDAAYLFLFSHARTVTSAAVRASVLGPYQAQAVLADAGLRERVSGLVKTFWDTEVEDAGQSVPVMDLWVGRHEKLYSRIFNS
ncbi:putative urease accessory protein UreF-like [Lasiodiplodia hormozganensis]|uniref:Urease accessory protein UreF-like n=1 Tax=Lasiodiplodia hormozganensis TaxID=869390 RepID=A0AA40D6F7_9PEZI|nr:putative urease accessory protein UreF-like [Lasiodiplodia hormozganensis]